MSKKQQYVNNTELLNELKKYKRQINSAKREGRERPKIPEPIGKAIVDIANNLAKMPAFSGYSFRDDMIGDAIINCITYIDNFNTKKSLNPFSYFTQIIYYAFIRRIKAERKHSYIKHKSLELFNIHNSSMSCEDKQYVTKRLKVDNEKATELIEKVERDFKRKKKLKMQLF